MIFAIYTPKTPCQPLEANLKPIFVISLLYVSIAVVLNRGAAAPWGAICFL